MNKQYPCTNCDEADHCDYYDKESCCRLCHYLDIRYCPSCDDCEDDCNKEWENVKEYID